MDSTREMKIKSCFSERRKVLCVYLFGSTATDKDNRFSDMDIAVLFNNDVLRKTYTQRQLCIMDDLSRILDKNVDVIVLNTANTFLKFQILKTGQKICESTDRPERNFEARTITEYFDFLPVRKKLETALIDHIKKG